MRHLVTILVLGGCLSLWAGAAAAKATTQLHCSETKCSYTEEIGPSGTKTYRGFCDGTGNTKVTNLNSGLVCHKAKGLTCTAGFFNEASSPRYWSCTCTNWSDKHRAHPDIDLSCPAPS